jgi:hypothetical protein
MRKPLHQLLGLGFITSLLLLSCHNETEVSNPPAALIQSEADVLQEHLHASRDGLYIDSSFSPQAVTGLHVDATFNGKIQGPTYAQPLFVTHGPSGKAAVIVATEQNIVYALDSGTGLPIWQKQLGQPVPLNQLPCGNIDPLGITGTPYIDLGLRTIYLDAMTTPDAGTTKKHLIFALSLDDGSTRPGWPVDVSATVTSNGISFDSSVQNQRGALAVIGGTLYVGYGGFFGDCGNYRGWVVGVPVSNPSTPKAWVASAEGGAVWAPGGIAFDGTSIFVATGNTSGATTWNNGEAILRLAPGPSFSNAPANYFAPADWQTLDENDLDIGGTQPVIFNLSGGSPSQLAMALGKNGTAYLLNRMNLGGIGGAIASKRVSSSPIITTPAVYPVSGDVMVAFKGRGTGCPSGTSGDLTSMTISPGSPPNFSVTWCAMQNGMGSPIVTTTDGTSNPIVWSIGAEGDGRLHGFDGKTGAVIFNGGTDSDVMSDVRRYQTPIVANKNLYVAGDNRIYKFKIGP